MLFSPGKRLPWTTNIPGRYKHHLLSGSYNEHPVRNTGIYLYQYNEEDESAPNGANSVNSEYIYVEFDGISEQNAETYVKVVHRNSSEHFPLEKLLDQGVDTVTDRAKKWLNSIEWPKIEDDKVKLDGALECIVRSWCVDVLRFNRNIKPGKLRLELWKLYVRATSVKIKPIRLVGIEHKWLHDGRKEQADRIEELEVLCDEQEKKITGVKRTREAALALNDIFEEKIVALENNNRKQQETIKELEAKLARNNYAK